MVGLLNFGFRGFGVRVYRASRYNQYVIGLRNDGS